MKVDLKVMMVPTFNHVSEYHSYVADACSQIRMLPHANNLNISSNLTIDIFRHVADMRQKFLDPYDIVWVNRTSLLRFPNRREALDLVASSGKKVVLDLDDAILDIDDFHSEASHYRALKQDLKSVIEISNLVLCSTPGVQKSVKQHCPHTKTKVIRNAIQKDWVSNKVSSKKPEKIKVCYYGTNTHKNDWKVIEAYVVDLAKRFPSVDFILIGILTQDELSSLPKNIFLRSSPVLAKYNYRAFLKFMIEDIKPDYILAPLEKTHFNYSKSELKALEALAFGATPIVSKGFEYDELSATLDDGRLFCDSASDWYDSLGSSVTGNLRVSKQSREKCLDEYSMENRSQEVLKALNEVIT